MRIFTPFPGEYIASALLRGNELLGVKTLPSEDFIIKSLPRRGYGRGIVGKAEYRSHAIFEFPPMFVEREVAAEVLQNYTLYPMMAALGRSTGKTLVTPNTWKKICPDCALKDFDTYGTAFVHREHVPPSVTVCGMHGSKLLEVCMSCAVPIGRHELSTLGSCSKQYPVRSRKRTSLSQRYSKFIADLLNYKGPTIKSDISEWVVNRSLSLKYSDELDRDEAFLSTFIKRELGVMFRTPKNRKYSDEGHTMRAFLGCETAKKYLDLVSDSGASAQLEKDVTELRTRKRQSRRYSGLGG